MEREAKVTREARERLDTEIYQNWVWSNYHGKDLPVPEQVKNNIFGLIGETGEVTDIAKKMYYIGRNISMAERVEELGDVLWHLTCLACIWGITLDEIMRTNIIKLERRYPSGGVQDREADR